MGLILWLKAQVRRPSMSLFQPAEARLPADLRLVRLYRTVRDFPGRTEAELARIIYGRPDPDLVSQDSRTLEEAGMIVRRADTGGLHATTGHDA